MRAAPSPYTRTDLLEALDALHQYDWAGFFADRVDRVAPRAPYGGIEQGGYKLAWQGRLSGWLGDDQAHHGYFDFSYSLGLKVGLGATVIDVLWDGPAFAAGVVRGMRIHSVGETSYSHAAMQNAIDLCSGGGGTVELVVERLGKVKTLRIECPCGQRYPTLEPAGDGPRLLDDILEPLATGTADHTQT